jgi:polyphosphate kinase
MPRNIHRRVEVLFPINDELLRAEIMENIFAVQWRDTEKGYWLQPDGTYLRAASTLRTGDGEKPLFDSQAWFLNGRVTLLQPQMPEVGD